MTWNYRIIHHDDVPQPFFAIHEVFYDEAGNITSWTAEPIDITAEGKAELVSTLESMLADSKLEPLTLSAINKTIGA